MTAKISRRGFVAGVTGAAFTYGFRIPFEVVAADEKSDEVNAWVVIKPDDTVVIRIARSEMGQGTLTGLAQLVAEELCCDWSKVTTEYPTPATNLKRNLVWKSFTTVASRGIRELADYVRQGGAAAREMLIAAAAKEWGIPPEECKAENSVITCERLGRKTTFGKVAAAAARIEPPKVVKLKDPKDWTVAGKPLKRLDTAGKLNGSQVYGIDLKLPGMLLASIKACPVAGGKVASFNEVAALKMPGVKTVVRVGDTAVAVVAETWWQAKTALDALPIEWDLGPNAEVSSELLAVFLKQGLTEGQAGVGNNKGDAMAAIAGAERRVFDQLRFSKSFDRTRNPPAARPAWHLARRERQPERNLHRMFYR